LNDIKAGTSNLLFFNGRRAYYIDIVSDFIEKMSCLKKKKDSIKPFCMVEMFLLKILFTAKRYPMMAERQVVIVKEAQDLSRTIDKLDTEIQCLLPF
jgi:DNA polymerase-3 subunit delta